MRAKRLSSFAKCGFWIAALLLVLNLARMMFTADSARATIAAPAPFTAILRNVVVTQSGESVESADVTTAVRADGSRVIQTQNRAGTRASSRILNFASGEQAYVNDVAGAKSTTQDSSRTATKWLRDPASQCLNNLLGAPIMKGEILLGTEVVSGFDTVKIQMGEMTSWFAPAHGCAMVRMRADWSNKSATEQRLVALIPGEPQRELFELSDRFREVPPSELQALSTPAPFSSARKAVLEREDKWYQEHRPR